MNCLLYCLLYCLLDCQLPIGLFRPIGCLGTTTRRLPWVGLECPSLQANPRKSAGCASEKVCGLCSQDLCGTWSKVCGLCFRESLRVGPIGNATGNATGNTIGNTIGNSIGNAVGNSIGKLIELIDKQVIQYACGIKCMYAETVGCMYDCPLLCLTTVLCLPDCPLLV